MKYLQIPIKGVSEQNLVSRKRIEEMLSDSLEKLRLSGLSIEAMKGWKMCPRKMLVWHARPCLDGRKNINGRYIRRRHEYE